MNKSKLSDYDNVAFIEDVEAKRVIISLVQPVVDQGRFPVKKCQKDIVSIKVVAFCDSHDLIKVRVKYWHELTEKVTFTNDLICNQNDEWFGTFRVLDLGYYYFKIEAWIDRFGSWRNQALKKIASDQLENVDLLEGIEILEAMGKSTHKEVEKLFLDEISSYFRSHLNDPTYIDQITRSLNDPLLIEISSIQVDKLSFVSGSTYSILVEARLAGFSSWYEFFPRSYSQGEHRHGTLKDAKEFLKYVAELGFSVIYLPPIHPIGNTFRKGKNNSQIAAPIDVGSPWAIGSSEGGHKSIHPALGSLADFNEIILEATDLGLSVAMDIAFQCSPDHPYVKEHPNWFYLRPDGSIHYAENPPKKYQDIYPINFETEDWQALWLELASIFLFWCERGVRIFRVDNPHTKPFHFWKWILSYVRERYKDVIFLSEAFTRPHRMYYLAKIGFSQSYTYFTWRNTKKEIIEYVNEITNEPTSDFFRPNFWPNTPDILAQALRDQNRTSFIQRLLLAGTLSANYGIYGPMFEICYNQPLNNDSEEYLDSEKYELKFWSTQFRSENIAPIIKRLNRIRSQHPALQQTNNINFLDISNDQLIAYLKKDEEKNDFLIIIISLDPNHKQSGYLYLPREIISIPKESSLTLHDLISDDSYNWHGERHYIEINPNLMPGHILHLASIPKFREYLAGT